VPPISSTSRFLGCSSVKRKRILKGLEFLKEECNKTGRLKGALPLVATFREPQRVRKGEKTGEAGPILKSGGVRQRSANPAKGTVCLSSLCGADEPEGRLA